MPSSKANTQKIEARKVVAFRRPVGAQIECKDNIDFMRSLKRASMNLIVTSPPYNIGKEYEKKTTNGLYIEQQAAAIAEAVRLLHPQGSKTTA